MPVFRIPDNKIVFPHPTLANSDGLLGIGGDHSPERFILAYQNGIFPWSSAGEPISWYCLLPRLILYPSKVNISKSMKVVISRNKFHFTIDQHFKEIMSHCKEIDRKGQKGSWIYNELEESFLELHQLGLAHSIEIWKENVLVGGLYGLAIGKMFCGESMFSKVTNASKFALIVLCQILTDNSFELIDCQQDTNHMKSMGAEIMGTSDFLNFLEKNKLYPQANDFWKNYSNQNPIL